MSYRNNNVISQLRYIAKLLKFLNNKKGYRPPKRFWIKGNIAESGNDAETAEKILLENTEVGKVYKNGYVKVIVFDNVFLQLANAVAPADGHKYEFQLVSQEKTAMVDIDDQTNLLYWELEFDAVGTPGVLLNTPNFVNLKKEGYIPEGGVPYWRNELWGIVDSDGTSATITFRYLMQCHYEIWSPQQLKNYSDAIA